MKKISFVIDSLEIGGAEKVLVELANILTCVCDVSIVAIYDGPLRYKLNNDVNVHVVVKPSKKNCNIFRLYGAIKRTLFIRFPLFFIPEGYLFGSTVVAFLENQALSAVSNINSTNDKIAWIHTNISKQNKKFKHNPDVYKRFHKVVFSSHSAKDEFNKEYGFINNFNQRVIYNGLDYELIKKLAEAEKISELDEFSVSIGRLCDAKNYINLVNNLHAAYQSGYRLKHYIIGDGPDKYKIEKEIKKLGLEGKVFLLGSMDNPYPYLKKATLLIHNAQWEGFGLAVVESIILKTKSIVRRNGATNEIVDLLGEGFLFDSDEELVELMVKYQDSSYQVRCENYKNFSYSIMSDNLQRFIDE